MSPSMTQDCKQKSVLYVQVFVVNSGSSGEGLREASGVLRHCLSSPSLSGLPLLLVCSKQDSPSAKTTTQVSRLHEFFKLCKITQEPPLGYIIRISQNAPNSLICSINYVY